MAAQIAGQAYQAKKQGDAQAEAYKLQAQAAAQNAAIVQHKSETQAESYAQKQKQLTDRYRLAVGNARSQAGASGISGESGSLMDSISASTDAYQQDSQNLLRNQREDSWASYVEQSNYLNAQNAYNQMAHNAKKQAKYNMWGTILGGAASIYGQGKSEGLWSKGNKTSGNTVGIWGLDHNATGYSPMTYNIYGTNYTPKG